MAWIQTAFANLPTHWAVLALVVGIGISVVLLRGIIRFALRAFLIGVLGVAVLGVLYYLINYTNLL